MSGCAVFLFVKTEVGGRTSIKVHTSMAGKFFLAHARKKFRSGWFLFLPAQGPLPSKRQK